MLNRVCKGIDTMLIIALAVTSSLLLIPTILGYRTMAVISGSMEPKIPVGSLIYVKEAEQAHNIGDVISYWLTEDTVVTHRITEIHEDKKEVITKGDANEHADAVPVAEAQILGKVAFSIPYLGYICIYVKTPMGIAAVCGILIILILTTFLPEIAIKQEYKRGEL